MANFSAFPRLGALAFFCLCAPAYAQTEAPATPPTAPPAQPEAAPAGGAAFPAKPGENVNSSASDEETPSQKSGGRKRTREKEAEGTEARDRFKADTVIKSKYKLDGESLEVDPD